MFEKLDHELDLLERAYRTLSLVRTHEPVGIRRISTVSDYEHHEVRTAFRLLEEEGLLEATPVGAVTTDAAEQALEEFDDDIDDVVSKIDTLRPPSSEQLPALTRGQR
ncbi:hypothetical protein [Haladaptatus sp. NG-WS-4]